ncbi:MAG: hypothetical protein ACJ8BF_09950 [Gemmatimonadales bacterium]
MRLTLLPRRVIGALVAFSAAASQAAGQWTAGIDVGADRYWGGSVETGGDHRSFRPYRPTVFGIGIERKGNLVAWGLRVRYTEAALGLEGRGAVAAVEGVFTVVSLSPEVVCRLATLGPGSELRLHAGPLFEIWGIIDEDTKARVGAQSAVSLNIPLGGRFAGSVLVGLAVTPSPFEANQLGEAFERRVLWRRGFAAGLQYRL